MGGAIGLNSHVFFLSKPLRKEPPWVTPPSGSDWPKIAVLSLLRTVSIRALYPCCVEDDVNVMMSVYYVSLCNNS